MVKKSGERSGTQSIERAAQLAASEQALPLARLPEIKPWWQKTAEQLQAESVEIQAFEKTFRAH